MNLKRLLTLALAVVFVGSLVSSVSASVILQNSATGGTIASFGFPNSMTYGQVFTAPITGTLDSFTLHLNGGVGALHGGVGIWNGTSSYGSGFGESANLYTSATVASGVAQSYTFNPNVSVVAGQRYVAYLSTFGDPASSTTSMPLGTSVSGIDYFVWNNTSDPKNNPNWNYFFNAGNALFSASFTSVPEPGSMVVFGVGTCIAGVLRLRRKVSKLKATA